MGRIQPPTDLEILKQRAEELWERQQDVFAEAARVAREAGRQGAVFAREEVAPRVRQAADSGADAVRSKVLPAVSSTLATVAALGDRGVREALVGIGRLRAAAPAPVRAVVPAKKGIGVGGWIGITLGVIAAGAVAYAVWQTLRADDDLWVEDEEPEAAEA